MVREKVRVSTRTLQWKCVESRADSKRLYYGRFILSPLMKGQADTIGIAMRRALLGEIEGTCITRAKSEKIPHEYSTIVEPINLCIELKIERNRGYRIKTLNTFQDGSYPIDAVFMPVRNANHSIHSYENGNEKQEILFLEIWTNGSLTPKEALYEASRNLIDLFIPFLHADEENLNLENNQDKVTLPLFTFHDGLAKLRKNKKEIALKSIFIDQLELPPRIYNCLKRSNIHTLLELLNNSQEDLMKMEHFRIEDVKRILDILEIEKHFV
uniref:DNA-directed RNA polymerase subunit alpha n=1 Tax=Cajanus cajan TaxID=3821 RepID=A0A151R2H5_CAJCA|nr:DNA-directed RNA polymerase subunit alpha [Cajanus cajan]